MKYFIPKSYQLEKTKKWTPSADLVDIIDGSNVNITEEFSLIERECDTKKIADKVIIEYLEKQGREKMNNFKPLQSSTS